VNAQEPPKEAEELEPAVRNEPAREGEERTVNAPTPADRLELDATQITGNRELPKVLYIVPWKRSDPGDLAGKPVGSLLDEVLEPVDREVFRRQNRYYRTLQPDDPDAAGSRPAIEPAVRDES
jgi:hypothetical protein